MPWTRTEQLSWTAAAAVCAIQAVRLAWGKPFSLDEFQYAHAAWAITQGQLPYRDFFEVHFPFVYQWLSLWARYRPTDPVATALALRVGMLPILGIGAWGVWRHTRSALGVALLLSLPDFISFATEIRPDPAAAAFFIAALALLREERSTDPLSPAKDVTPPSSSFWRSPHTQDFVGGLCLAASMWCSQKAVFYAIPTGVWLLWRVRRFALAGLSAGVLGVLGYLTITGSLGAFIHWCLTWAAEHQRGYPGFPFTHYFLPILQAQLPLFALAALGMAHAWRKREALLVLISVPFTFASFALQKAPFPYSFTPFLLLMVLFAARGVALTPSPLRLPALVALLIVQGVQLENRIGNRGQLETLARLSALTSPTDVVYDNSGGYIARPHAHFYFYTDAFIRSSRAEELTRDIPRALLETGCVARLDDLRTEALPEGLRRFLTENYQAYDADLFLWGNRNVTDRFYAITQGDYFATNATSLQIDGTRVDPARFTLAKGWHQVRTANAVEILWLPRNGERWSPKPGLKPTFSRLF